MFFFKYILSEVRKILYLFHWSRNTENYASYNV